MKDGIRPAVCQCGVDLFFFVQLPSVDSWAEPPFPLPFLRRSEGTFPKRIGPTLDGPFRINGAALIPEDAIVIFFLFQAEDEALAQIDPAAVFFDKILWTHSGPQGQGIKILAGEEDVSRIMPATVMTLGTFKFQTLVKKCWNHIKKKAFSEEDFWGE